MFGDEFLLQVLNSPNLALEGVVCHETQATRDFDGPEGLLLVGIKEGNHREIGRVGGFPEGLSGSHFIG